MKADSDLLNARNPALGAFAAVLVVFIWSSWLVISRAGALTALTPYDLAAIRYGVSAVFALPIVLYFKPWRAMSVARIATITVLLGPLYVLMVFAGFEYAPAAHGGIFMNGALPIVTLLIGRLWLSQYPTRRQIVASLIILAGVVMTVGDTTFAFRETWRGDLMFVGAAIFFCLYVVASRLWDVTAVQVLMCSSLLNAITFVPVWYLFLPSGFHEATSEQVWLQILFQGLVPNLFGLLMVALAARNLGPSGTSAFMASVPGLGAFLSLVFLDEPLGPMSWLGLAVLTAGILFMTIRKVPQP